MTTTVHKFTPSINIVRDAGSDLSYLPTANGNLVFKQITESYKAGGKRSFSIVGSYGTGKSAFLWALQNTLTHKQAYFNVNKEIPKFNFLSIVGEADSFMEVLSKEVNATQPTAKSIFSKLNLHYQKAVEQSLGLAIVVDEFGKFLEHAVKHNPEKELYFVQQLAEWANDPKKEILFVVTLHQGFDAYALGLEKSQRQEWNKVKGRLKELVFNEPVEQLLALAAQRLKEESHKKPERFDELFEAIAEAKVFPLQSYFDRSTAENLLPFDILSASVLTLALQKYGQNERSLFSFIEGNEYLSTRDFSQISHPFYNLSCVYDYLIYHYYTVIVSKYNPHYTQWAAIRNALERVEGLSVGREQMENTRRLVKTIGLLNIFAPASAKLDPAFMMTYGTCSLGISAEYIEELLRDTEKVHKIVSFRSYLNKYRFQGESNLDIELAINKAGELVTQVPDFVSKLNSNFTFPHILAKQHFFKTGTPRFFSFRLTEEPIAPSKEVPTGELDGFINLIFSEQTTEDEIQQISQNCEEAIFYGWFRNVSAIKHILLEIEKVKKVIEEQEHEGDIVAVRELRNIWNSYRKTLTHEVFGNLYADNGSVEWFFKGKKKNINSQGVFNRQLSEICDKVYEYAPHLHFEMINKTKLSSAMLTARKKLVEQLVVNHTQKDLGFEPDKFPPEKSIYLALLKQTGIHQENLYGAFLTVPVEDSFRELWKASQFFLDNTKSGKRNITELIDKLSKRPFKIKKGLLDFWLPVYLFIKRDDFALFGENGYIPNLTHEVLELLVKEPQLYAVKSFDVEGVKLDLFNRYRELLSQTQELQFSNAVFIETIKPFLVFYKQLPDYAKLTQQLSPQAIQLRRAIATAKDPEKSFFEDFPQALGYTTIELQRSADLLATYVPMLEKTIREIRTAFEQLIKRFEYQLQTRINGNTEMAFPAYKEELQQRYKKVKKHLLLPHQKVFLQRINSAIDDRQAWLLSIAEACLGKRLEQITDEEELVLMDRLHDFIAELDQLNGISAHELDENKEIAFELQISSLAESFQKHSRFVRLPKSKKVEMERIEADIRVQLGHDRELNIAILAKLLQEQISHDTQS